MNGLKLHRNLSLSAACAFTAIIVFAGASALAEKTQDGDDQQSAELDKKTITLNIKKGDIGDALRLVAEQGGLNLVIGPDVKGEVSVYLTEASLDTALKAIAINNGFTYRLEDGVITVSRAAESTGAEPPPQLVTRVFNLRSQDAERVKDALEFALTKHGKMKVLNQNSQGGYGVQRLSSLGGELNGAGGSGSSGGAVNATAGNTGNGMSSNPGMSGAAQSGTDRARNARTLVITDTVEAVERIGNLIADLDRLPPQVLIEARIVEMTTDLQRQLGIDWNIDAIANGPILNHGWPLENKAGFASGSQIMRHFNGSPYQSTGLALGTVDFSQLTALIRANETDTAIRLLANPRLLVYNNHSASILVGERYPILQANISNFGTATESLQTYIPVGVQLEVTPTIMMDGAISMLVHPATSALGDDVVGTTGLRVARIRTRELDTRVIMQDGQTIVLGGLISDRKLHQARKVPGLGDVPGLDAVFRQENPRSERVDLLIFLTARVESATQISERDQEVFDMYKPHFKQIERLQDVPLHFEIPTEYQPARPMFSDPPAGHTDEVTQEEFEHVQSTPPEETAEESTESAESSTDEEDTTVDAEAPVTQASAAAPPASETSADSSARGAPTDATTVSSPEESEKDPPVAASARPTQALAAELHAAEVPANRRPENPLSVQTVHTTPDTVTREDTAPSEPPATPAAPADTVQPPPSTTAPAEVIGDRKSACNDADPLPGDASAVLEVPDSEWFLAAPCFLFPVAAAPGTLVQQEPPFCQEDYLYAQRIAEDMLHCIETDGNTTFAAAIDTAPEVSPSFVFLATDAHVITPVSELMLLTPPPSGSASPTRFWGDRPEVEAVLGVVDGDEVPHADADVGTFAAVAGEHAAGDFAPQVSKVKYWIKLKWSAVLSAWWAAQQPLAADHVRASLQAWQGSSTYDQP